MATQNKTCKIHTFNLTKITDSRIEGLVTRRKRKCKICGMMFFTEEHLVAEGQNPWRKNAPPSKPSVKIDVKPKKRRTYRSRDLDELTDEELETALMEGNILFDEDEM